MVTPETNKDYENIDRPYDDFLFRSEQNTDNGSVETKPVKDAGGLNDLWIRNFIRSENWKPKTSGFYIDGLTGYAEFSNVFVSGDIQAVTGTIGGFAIGATTISATNLVLTSGAANTANITVGTGATSAGLNSANASGDIAFWAGDTFANRATAPFRVTAGGAVTVSSLTATGGSITGLTITGGTIRTSSGADRVEMDGVDNALYVYSSGDVRGGFTGFSLFFNGPSEVGGGSIYSAGTQQINFTVSGASEVELNETSLTPTTDAAIDLGSGFRWKDIFASGTIEIGGLAEVGSLDVLGATDLGSTVSIVGTLTYKTTPMPRVFHGLVQADGTSGGIPSGWSCSKLSTGDYRVTHDLSSASYDVVLSIWGIGLIWITSEGTDDFEVKTTDLGGTDEDSAFNFILCRNP